MNPIPFHRALKLLFPARRVVSDRTHDFRRFWSSLHDTHTPPDGPRDPVEAVAWFKKNGVPYDAQQHLAGAVFFWQARRRRQQRVEAGKKSAKKRAEIASSSETP